MDNLFQLQCIFYFITARQNFVGQRLQYISSVFSFQTSYVILVRYSDDLISVLGAQCGKSAAIYACSMEHGFTVIEVCSQI